MSLCPELLPPWLGIKVRVSLYLNFLKSEITHPLIVAIPCAGSRHVMGIPGIFVMEQLQSCSFELRKPPLAREVQLLSLRCFSVTMRSHSVVGWKNWGPRSLVGAEALSFPSAFFFYWMPLFLLLRHPRYQKLAQRPVEAFWLSSVFINLQFAKNFPLKVNQSHFKSCTALIMCFILFLSLSCLGCLILGHHLATYMS